MWFPEAFWGGGGGGGRALRPGLAYAKELGLVETYPERPGDLQLTHQHGKVEARPPSR